MAAETNTIMQADVSTRVVDFNIQFAGNLNKLIEALGVTRKIAVQEGATLKMLKVTGTLESGNVAEGDLIPLSKYETEDVAVGEVKLNKWRKATSAEAILKGGYDQAVGATTDKMVKDIQKGIRGDLFTFMATGTGKASGINLQSSLANGWGQLQVLFEDDEIQTVHFINPLDIADYLATAQVTTQTAFGMTYIENFLGMGRVFLNSSVPKGKIYSTAQDNLILYYIPVNGADLGEAFNFTADETGYIGIHETPDYTNMTASDTVISGVTIFAERLDGVVVATIGAGE